MDISGASGGIPEKRGILGGTIALFLSFNVVLYGSNLFVYVYQSGVVGIKPLYFYVMTIGAAIMVALWHSISNSYMLPRQFILWLFVTVGYYIFLFLFSSQSEIATQILISYLEAIALLLSFLALCRDSDSIRVVRISLLMVVALSLLLNIYDFFVPTFSDTMGRAAGFYLNPNFSGFMLVLTMVASISVVPPKWRFIFSMLVGVGVLITFSRGGWLLWGVAISGLVFYNYLTISGRAIGSVIALLAVLLIYSLYSGAMLEWLKWLGVSDYLHPGAIARIAGDESFSDDSAVSRIQAAYHAWGIFAEHPWFGSGLGYTREWDFGVSPHNMFLTMAAEGGVVGVGILTWLFYLLWRVGDDIGKLIAALLMLFSMFSHNVVETPAIMLVCALIIASRPGREPGTPKQKTII